MKDITVVCDQYEWSKLKDFGGSFGFLGFNIPGKRTGKKPLTLCKEIFILRVRYLLNPFYLVYFLREKI